MPGRGNTRAERQGEGSVSGAEHRRAWRRMRLERRLLKTLLGQDLGVPSWSDIGPLVAGLWGILIVSWGRSQDGRGRLGCGCWCSG